MSKTTYPDKTYSSHEEWQKKALRRSLPAEQLIENVQAVQAILVSAGNIALADCLRQAVENYRAMLELENYR